MIQSKKDYLFYLEADRIALGRRKRNVAQKLKALFFPDHIWKFQRTLRKLEYMANTKTGGKIGRMLVARKFQRLSVKLGFSIPINVFGAGLSIAHYGTIIVNTGAKVGNNCRLHAGVNIGTEAGYGNKAPVMGNNIYIGPGAKIFGAITLADNIAVGANAVVNKSFEENNIAIGGIPAKKLGDTQVENLLINATRIIELGLNKTGQEAFTAMEWQQKIQEASSK